MKKCHEWVPPGGRLIQRLRYEHTEHGESIHDVWHTRCDRKATGYIVQGWIINTYMHKNTCVTEF